MQRQEGTAPLQKLSVAPSQTRHSAISNKSGSMHHPHSRYLLSYLFSLSLSLRLYFTLRLLSLFITQLMLDALSERPRQFSAFLHHFSTLSCSGRQVTSSGQIRQKPVFTLYAYIVILKKLKYDNDYDHNYDKIVYIFKQCLQYCV